MGKAKGANCEGEEEDVTVIVVQRFPSTTNKQMIHVKNEADKLYSVTAHPRLGAY